MDTKSLTISTARALIAAGQLTGSELTRACLAVIEEKNPALNAFACVSAEDEREENEIKSYRSPLSFSPHLRSIPLAIKDLIHVSGLPTRAGSPRHFDSTPAPEDAFVVEKLRAAGATLLGKTNTHEIALGITGINPHTGAVRNPRDPSRITGGSSSGSAAAVAAGMCLAALGTDTGGSVRIPASLCGVVGFKPTFGRVSTRGVLPLSWNLDHVGVLAKTVEDVALVYQVIAGYDEQDPNSVAGDVISLEIGQASIPPHRIAIAVGDYIEAADAEIVARIQEVARVFEKLGAQINKIEIPRLRETAAANGTMVVADAAAFHRERLDAHPDWFGADVCARLEQGRAVTSTEYALARRVQSEMNRYFDLFFRDYDLLLLPTTATVAAPIEGLDSAAYAPRLTRFTAPFNLTGLPALSIPCGEVDGLPFGAQLVAARWNESALLRAGQMLERAL
jgi:aspartyl-tRNA(Asn)/glutamyl-tRNA(Gln) amidotransferase subunit A